jgi:hypothetical protein
VKPGHIDGAAGLKPIGTFYFTQAMLLAVPAVFLAAWWFLFPLWPGPNYSHWRDPYLGMLLVVLGFEVAAFVMPMWRFHILMRERKDELIACADTLSTKIENLRLSQAHVDTGERAAHLKEQLAAMEREYWDIERMPTWPVDVATWRQFARTNVVLVLPLITKLVGAESVAGRILATLDEVLKK